MLGVVVRYGKLGENSPGDRRAFDFLVFACRRVVLFLRFLNSDIVKDSRRPYHQRVSMLGLENSLSVAEHFKSVYYAARPPSERLVTKKLDLRGVSEMRDWKTSLKEYLETYYQEYL